MSTINYPCKTKTAQSADTVLPVEQADKFDKSTISTDDIMNRLKLALELPPTDDTVRTVVYADFMRVMLRSFASDQHLQDFVRWLRSELTDYGA